MVEGTLLFFWFLALTDCLFKFLRDYFYANGEGPVPQEVLQNQKYRDILSIRLYYDWHTYVCSLFCFDMVLTGEM